MWTVSLRLKKKDRAQELIYNADAVIYGSAPEELVKKRMKDKKLTFRFTERLYKEPFTIRNCLYRLLSAIKHHGIYQNKKVYILCAGAYVAYDFSRYGYYKNKCFQWCYFTKISERSLFELQSEKNRNKQVELVWTARFVEVKHPEKVIYLAQYLKRKNMKFHITMIGSGELLDSSKQLAARLGVADIITFTGALTPEKTQEYMERADISLFTSDRREGWGAVVNEAMGCACAVVASSAAGSPPFLINNNENGMLFDIDRDDDFYEKVQFLMENVTTRKSYGEKAYDVIHRLWSPKNAAESFIKLAQSVLEGEIKPMKEGPCSPAYILKDGWLKIENKK